MTFDVQVWEVWQSSLALDVVKIVFYFIEIGKWPLIWYTCNWYCWGKFRKLVGLMEHIFHLLPMYFWSSFTFLWDLTSDYIATISLFICTGLKHQAKVSFSQFSASVGKSRWLFVKCLWSVGTKRSFGASQNQYEKFVISTSIISAHILL